MTIFYNYIKLTLFSYNLVKKQVSKKFIEVTVRKVPTLTSFSALKKTTTINAFFRKV